MIFKQNIMNIYNINKIQSLDEREEEIKEIEEEIKKEKEEYKNKMIYTFSEKNVSFSNHFRNKHHKRMLLQMIIYGVFLMIFVFVVIYQLNVAECNKQRLVGQSIQDI